MSARGSDVQLLPTSLTTVAWLAAVSMVELLVLRTATRVAIHIPAAPAFAELYRVTASLGRFAYFLTLVLLAVALPQIGLALWRSGAASGRSAMGALMLFAVAVLMTSQIESPVPGEIATIAVVIFIASLVATGAPRRAAVPVACFAAAFALRASHTVIQELGLGAEFVDEGAWLLAGAEAAAVAFALSSPLLVPAPVPRVAQAIGVAAAGLLLATLLSGGSSTMRILLLWNEGLTGAFPAVIYAASGGALISALVALLEQRQIVLGAALTLLVTGGVGLHSTYQSALVVAGLAVLLLRPVPPQEYWRFHSLNG